MESTAVPLPLVAAAVYAGDQPNIDQLERALDAARTALRLPGSLEREEARQRFIYREGREAVEREQESPTLAAQVHYGDAAFAFGLATAWLLLCGRGGAQ
jgi:hypothetical protein